MQKKTWNIFVEKAILDKVESGTDLETAVQELKAHMFAESEWIGDGELRYNFRKKMEEHFYKVSDVEELNTALQGLKGWSDKNGKLSLEGIRQVKK